MTGLMAGIGLGWLVGCPSGSTPPDPDPADAVEWRLLPVAPLDPVVGTVRDVVVEPIVEDASGQRIALEPGPLGWVAKGGFPPGEYRAVAVAGGEPPLEDPPAFTVRPYGGAPLDAAGLVGRAWKVEQAVDSAGFADLAMAQGAAWLRIDAADADEVEFRIVVDAGEPCVALRDRGAWDASVGTLSWSVDHATVELPGDTGAAPATVDAWGGALRVDWLAGNDRSAWGAAGGTASSGEVTIWSGVGADPQAGCDLLGSLGVACGACPDGVGSDCVTDALVHVVWTEDPAAPDPAPRCGIDRVDADPIDLEPISCEWEAPAFDVTCGCHAPAAQVSLPGLGVAALVVARRRRREGGRRSA